MTRVVRIGFVVGLALLAINVSAQQGSQFSLSVSPQIVVPVGDTQPFAFGGGASVNAGFRTPSAPRLTFGAQFGYCLLSPGIDPSSSSITNASVITIGPTASLALTRPGPVLASIEAQAGYGLVPYQGLLGSIGYGTATANLSFRLGSAFSIGILGGYTYQLQLQNIQMFSHGVVAGVGFRYYIGGASRARLEMIDQRLEPIFPVFHSHYDDHPFGSVRLQNLEPGEVRNVRVSLNVPGYMSQPRTIGAQDSMPAEGEVDIPLVALFNPSILAVTDTTKVSAELVVTYDYLDAEKEVAFDLTLDLYHRNAMSWDDDRKAAAFITPTDPDLLRYSRAIAAGLRSSSTPAINSVFRQSIALFEAMRAHGIQYVQDPTTPYSEFSQNKFAIDYLQFPTQTLDYSAGDCDDLSILYAALLESVGVETGFVTVPGHIYVAVSLGLSEAQARRTFSNADDLMFVDNNTWLPVEVTMVESGFNEAWHYGAREWREHSESGNAKIIPIRDAWKTYESVEFSDPNSGFATPDLQQVLSLFNTELERFIDDQIGEPVATLRDRIAAGRRIERYQNQLGAMLAQYGRYEQALVEFEVAAAAGYVPAQVNMANLHMLTERYADAEMAYRAVLDAEPQNVAALVGFAKVNRQLENYGLVRSTYETLAEIDPETASEFAYLIGEENLEGRASSAVQQETFIWPVEE